MEIITDDFEHPRARINDSNDRNKWSTLTRMSVVRNNLHLVSSHVHSMGKIPDTYPTIQSAFYSFSQICYIRRTNIHPVSTGLLKSLTVPLWMPGTMRPVPISHCSCCLGIRLVFGCSAVFSWLQPSIVYNAMYGLVVAP